MAQCDLWFPSVDIPAGFDQVVRPPVLVIVMGYSRINTAQMIPSRQSEDLLAGQWALLSGWGRVPRPLASRASVHSSGNGFTSNSRIDTSVAA